MTLDLAAVEYGEGSPVIILHGLFGTGGNWAQIAKALATRHRVFALDLRNHGASPWAPTMSYAEMADDVRAFIQARGLGPVAGIGHSMGGKAAMMLALRDAAVVERLVVVDIAPASYPSRFLGYVRAMRAVDLTQISRRSQVAAQIAEAVPDSGERAFLLMNLEIEDGRARWRPNLEALERAIPEISGFPDLPAGQIYPGPALFVAGARSDYIKADHEAAIRQRFPQAQIEIIPDAGHWVHAERPDAFLQIVTPFLGGG